MARTRASDYDDKRRVILDRSAALFAEYGFDRASMNAIAEACGVSKANLYHYYDDKEELLFDMIRSHLETLVGVVETATRPELPAAARLQSQIVALLDAYRHADAQHDVQISGLRLLPAASQTKLRALERTLVDLVARTIDEIAPHLKPRRLLKPVTMSLFGMLNWHYRWFKDGGGITRADYAALTAGLILDGVRHLPASTNAKRDVPSPPVRLQQSGRRRSRSTTLAE